jgi:DNA-binding NtrC family response regulator
VQTILESHGYGVLLANDGENAIRVAHRHTGPIHLMLTDMVMPRMNGRELAKQLAPLRPEMKVLFMSGYIKEDITSQDTLNPEMCFIQKPFTTASLLSKLRELLERSRSASFLG